MESKPDHLREAKIGILPFLFLVKILCVPLLAGLYDVGELAIADDVIFRKFATHQYAVRRARKMQLHFRFQLFCLLQQVFY